MVDKQIAEASHLLRQRLRETMEQQGLKTQEQLAEYLGIPRNTIGPYFCPMEHALPTPETLEKLRGKITVITDDEARLLETAYSRKLSLSRARGAEKRWGKKQPHQTKNAAPSASLITAQQTIPSLSSPNDKDATIGRLVRQLLTAITQNGSTKPLPTDSIALLCSQAEQRYQIGDMPSVLTKDNFKAVDVSQWSAAEQQQFLSYANLVLEESRKCLLLLAQFEPGHIRDNLLERLARNADLLWRTYKAASSVAPIEYVQDIELARKCEQL